MSAAAAVAPPVDLDAVALLLDLDGTLVDIAATPDAVLAPPGLGVTLARLARRLDDALAVVSGRRLEDVDRILAPLRLAAAGEHGAVIRLSGDAEPQCAALPPMPSAWRRVAAEWAALHPGVLLEEKRASFVLHYRQAPAVGPMLHAALTTLLAGDHAHEILAASCAWEVRPRGIDKGMAVHSLMRGATFRGRRPVFIGDDRTDEDGIAAAEALGGFGLRVADSFGDAAGVRAWLAGLVA